MGSTAICVWLIEHGIDLNMHQVRDLFVFRWIHGLDDPDYNPCNEVDRYLVSCGAKL